MSKMSSHDPFGRLKHKLWPKEGSKVKLAVWLLTIKSQESPRFPCMQVACHIQLESSQRGLQFCFRLISIGGLHAKLWAPKVMGIPTFGIWRLPLGNLGTKWHMGAGPVARHRVYYKGEGGGFPQIWAMVSLVSPCLPVTCSCTKVIQLRTNQLVVWFVQVRVSNWIDCQSS
jgi:hypothetical protein